MSTPSVGEPAMQVMNTDVAQAVKQAAIEQAEAYRDAILDGDDSKQASERTGERPAN